MSEKKVVVVIVEGPSDENAIGGILKDYFSSEEVQFAVVHGDITSNDSTSIDNVVSKIDSLINGIRSKYGYLWTDFVRIIHIADTDGAFTKECIQEVDVEGIQYYEDHMESSNVEALSDDFADKYEGKVQEFIDFISNEAIAVSGTYKETWKYIEKDKNSLHRHSNMHLIFQ